MAFQDDVEITDLDEQNAEKFPFIIDVQYSIIHLMLKNEEFGRECFYHVKPVYFGTSYLAWFVKFIFKYYETYERIPSEVTVRNELLKFDAAERVAYEKVLDRILKSNIEDEPYIQDKLTEFTKQAIMRNKYESSRDKFNAGDTDEAIKVLSDITDEVNRVNFKRDKFFNFNNHWDFFEQQAEELKDRIPLGIPPIDQALGGGLAKKQLTLFLGGTNTGKSIVLTNCLVNMVNAGFKVLYIDLENDEAELPMRVYACATGIKYNRLYRYRYNFDAAEKANVEKMAKSLQEKAKLSHWHEYNLNVENLIAFAERHKRSFDYDALIIDYAQVLKTARRYDKTYSEHGEVHRMLALFATKNNVSVITAAQGNREAQKKQNRAKDENDLVESTDIADSFEIIRKAAVVITITRSKKQAENNRMVYLLDKQRRGKTRIAVEFETDFDSIRAFNKDMKWKIYGEDELDDLEVYSAGPQDKEGGQKV